jgi:hypothetical protein
MTLSILTLDYDAQHNDTQHKDTPLIALSLMTLRDTKHFDTKVQ